MLLPAYYRWNTPVGKHQSESAPKLRSFECWLAYDAEMVSGLFQNFRLGARPLKSVQIFDKYSNTQESPKSDPRPPPPFQKRELSLLQPRACPCLMAVFDVKQSFIPKVTLIV